MASGQDKLSEDDDREARLRLLESTILNILYYTINKIAKQKVDEAEIKAELEESASGLLFNIQQWSGAGGVSAPDKVSQES